jgi:hypothetical protein
MPVIAAGGGGVAVLAAGPLLLHPDSDPAAIKAKSAQVGVFMNRSPS